MKLLVIGAGYVGTSFLKALQKSSYEIGVTTTQESRVKELEAFGEVFLLTDTPLEEAVEACDAAVILVAPKKTSSHQETYLETAKTIIHALQGRKDPFYLLYTSSSSVLEGLEGWVDEEVVPTPTSQNAKILLETESIYQKGWKESCILRLGGIYGPGRELKDRALKLSGKEMAGDVFTNHIHLEDIVGAIKLCLEKRLTGLYHLVNDSHPTRKDLYGKLCRDQNVPEPIWIDSMSTGYKVSNQKIKTRGFVLKHPHV